MRRLLACTVTVILGVGLAAELAGAPPKAPDSTVRELRVQTVGDVTYFHVRLDTPRDMAADGEQQHADLVSVTTPSLAPRLVADGGAVRLVCRRLDPNRPADGPPLATATPAAAGGAIESVAQVEVSLQDQKGAAQKQAPGQAKAKAAPRPPVPVQGLEFVGRCDPAAAAKVRLLYPVAGQPTVNLGGLVLRARPAVWKEVELVLDFPKAPKVSVPPEAAQRTQKQPAAVDAAIEPPVRDDLEGLWAAARAAAFYGQAHEATDFGFYDFARASTARRYGVHSHGGAPMINTLQMGRPSPADAQFPDSELYELTTGAAAITESLQTRRMNAVAARRDERRTVAVDTIKGIDIAEHPWEKMMGGRRPEPEPLARLVPRDNYYIRFRRLDKFIEFSDLLDQWGTNLIRTYELTSRDYLLKKRYEQQLCLRSTALGRTLGPLVVRGIAFTGNDPYLREGTDVCVLFQVIDRNVFFAAVEPFIAEARQKFGARLTQGKDDYHGVTVESFVTPRREVSLYRAGVGDVVAYANSPAGIRRVLDAAAGRGKCLADSPDFQYMRTIFRPDDADEDGFAFLSDPFIRGLVGPAGKIKERRRLEALTSLQMLTYGAMLARQEGGKPPTSAADVLRATGLSPAEVPLPEGKPAAWDGDAGFAISDVYNTIHFATPLVELPIDRVTPTEAAEYQRFRLEYLGLWRQYFDPIGMRVSLREGRVKLETYILPLVENSAYNQLRNFTGKGTVHLDPSRLSPKTLVQYVTHLSTDATERGNWPGFQEWRQAPESTTEFVLNSLLAWVIDPIGEWFLVRLDDSPNYERLVQLTDKMSTGEPVDVEDVARLVWTLPVAIGVDVKNALTLTAGLTALRTAAMMSLPGALTWAPLEKEYKGVPIVRIRATPAGTRMLGQVWGEHRQRKSDPFLPAIYYAVVGGGLYVTLNEDMMRELIDGAQPLDKSGGVEVNTSLHLAPGAAVQTKGLLKRFLESQTHRQARQGLPVWQALYDCELVPKDAPAEDAAATAFRYLGFVPVSPDGSKYRYDNKYAEVTNERHGSYRVPVLNKTMADDSPVNRLLETLRSIRADLRFREDGIHTVLTLER
jgi:hypothetical protein